MDTSSRITSVSHGPEGEACAGLVDRGHRVSSDAVNVDNRVFVAVSVGWDVNSSMGGREDVTMEEKWEGDRGHNLIPT